jgi:hypothetical protein
MQNLVVAEVRLTPQGGRGNAGPVESVENQRRVSHAFHRPLKISQRRRDFHISTAPAYAVRKSGKPIPGFPLSHPAHAMTTTISLSSNQKTKKGVGRCAASSFFYAALPSVGRKPSFMLILRLENAPENCPTQDEHENQEPGGTVSNAR